MLEEITAIGLPINEFYGSSEVTIVTASPPDRIRLGTSGTPLPGVRLRLGDDGEVLIAGPTVTPGYFRDPERTAEVLDVIRAQGVGLDDFFQRWGNRLLGRRKKMAAWPDGLNVEHQPHGGAAARQGWRPNQPAADRGGTLTSVTDGLYTYTYGMRAPTAFDRLRALLLNGKEPDAEAAP